MKEEAPRLSPPMFGVLRRGEGKLQFWLEHASFPYTVVVSYIWFSAAVISSTVFTPPKMHSPTYTHKDQNQNFFFFILLS
jgi:hypothetical protein